MDGVQSVIAKQRYSWSYDSFIVKFYCNPNDIFHKSFNHLFHNLNFQKGQPGFCDGTDYEDADYDENTPDDVSYYKSWGYCDKKCHISVRDLGATVLQEVAKFNRMDKIFL